MYILKTISKDPYFTIRSISPQVQPDTKLNFYISDPINETKTVTLPLPDCENILSPIKILTIRNHTFEFNMNLFKEIMIKYLTGLPSWDSLRVYATGYALRRFVLNNKEISNPHIKYE